jgi:hypothetical protein
MTKGIRAPTGKDNGHAPGVASSEATATEFSANSTNGSFPLLNSIPVLGHLEKDGGSGARGGVWQ